MSWSISGIGKVEALKRLLQKNSEQLTGQSKTEFDEARPHIEALLDQNVNGAYPAFAMKLEANGHGSFEGGKKTYGSCQVTLLSMGQLIE